MMLRTRWKGVMAAALAMGASYSLVHVWVSGVRSPGGVFSSSGQMREELPAVEAYVRAGGPVHLTNPRQYGSTFFFLVEPLLRWTGGEPRALAGGLYALQLLTIGLAALLATLWLRRWAGEVYGEDAARAAWPKVLLVLGLLWVNFSPVYYTLAVKGVESWELCLLSGGCYAALRERRAIAGLCIAAAALTKMLPLFFLFYFLLRDRRLLAASGAWLVLLLAASHLRYGPEMGLGYLPFMLRASMGHTWALTYHENISLKGMIAKAFGSFHVRGDFTVDGKYVVLEGAQLKAALLLGHLVQAAGLVWIAWTLRPWRADRTARRTALAWEWAFVSVMMLVLSPQTAFEYTVLALPAFSLVAAALTLDPVLRRRRSVWLTFGPALLLVANLVPRQCLNWLLQGPIDALLRWSGNGHFNRSEGYQYFGFPLVGLLALIAALWAVRDRCWRPQRTVA